MVKYHNKKKVLGKGRGKYGLVTTVYGGKNYKTKKGSTVIDRTFRTKDNAEKTLKKFIKHMIVSHILKRNIEIRTL